MILILSELLEHNSYPSVGTIIYDKLITEEKVTIDCSNTIIPAVLLNASIGRFIDEHGYEALHKRLMLQNITQGQGEMIINYIKNYDKQ